MSEPELEYDSFRSGCGTWRADGTPPPMIGSAARRKRDPRVCAYCTRARMEPRDGKGICAICGWGAGTFGFDELMRMQA